MSVKITYFAHGTTTDNEAGLSSGWKDVELSELGKQQSAQLTELTKHHHFDAVFTSDLVRAIDSAKITWGDTYTIIQDKRLRECNYGDYNGKPSEVVEPLQEQSVDTPMPNGESYEQVKARVAEFLEDLQRSYDGKHVAIVGHKAPQLALDVLLRNLTWEEAFARDWRKAKQWQPGWEYTLDWPIYTSGLDLLATSANGKAVLYDSAHSHAATHFADTPQLKQLVQEVLAQTTLDGDQMFFETDLKRTVGNSDLVVNDEDDEIVYAKRKNRDIYTSFNKTKGPQPSSLVTTCVSKLDEDRYKLFSAWIGSVNSPPFPGDPNETPESKPYWLKHSLAWGRQEVQAGTETSVCPW